MNSLANTVGDAFARESDRYFGRYLDYTERSREQFRQGNSFMGALHAHSAENSIKASVPCIIF
jgi:hypothetical protein